MSKDHGGQKPHSGFDERIKGMHSWVRAITQPDYMDAVIALAVPAGAIIGSGT
jgi:hypothetical protein